VSHKGLNVLDGLRLGRKFGAGNTALPYKTMTTPATIFDKRLFTLVSGWRSGLGHCMRRQAGHEREQNSSIEFGNS
jgi:hypothetical protein